jgi:GNAT superfamily N-acetyltransferase
MNKDIELLLLHGKEIEPWLEDIARLRISVFREYPYLYDGTMEYEKEYLQVYVHSPGSLIAVARSESGKVIGATTALPMSDADKAFQDPFLKNGYSLDEICYLGESVLLQEWRGIGLGHRFFDEREKHARNLGCTITSFCAVVRTESHLLKPDGYFSHDRFWEGRGYEKVEGLSCFFPWKDIDQADETVKELQFWLKASK